MSAPPIPDAVRHAAMRFNAPLSEDHAAALLDALELEHATRVLDLGCGWGELLLRAVADEPALTGVGVDSDAGALARADRLRAERGLADRVRFVEAGAETWREPAERVICVGASHALGGTADALCTLAELVEPGGRLLFGDGYLEPGPSAATRELFGELLGLAELLAAAADAGWRTLHCDVSDAREWDVFESSFRAGPERWLLDHPDIPDADEIRAWLDERLREYVDGYRGELGFAWLVLARAGG